jgi:superoxide dismutase, Cu-Zn family
MPIRSSVPAVVAFLAFTLACSPRAAHDRSAIVATMFDTAGREVGTASATSADGNGVALDVRVAGISPGAHGIHIHAIGACDRPTTVAYSSAGGHFNPTAKQHGRLNPSGWHVGDLPNIVVDSATGRGSMKTVVESLTLQDGLTALLDGDGSAIVVHANRDDERTDTGPAGPGNSGARVACGVFRVVPP